MSLAEADLLARMRLEDAADGGAAGGAETLPAALRQPSAAHLRSGAHKRQQEQEATTASEQAATAQPRRTTVTVATKHRFEEDWSVSALEQLKDKFMAQSEDGRLDEAGFVDALTAQIRNSASAASFLRDLFCKICQLGDTTISWDEFATYMLLEYQKKDDTYQRSKKVPLRLPASEHPLPCRGHITKMRLNSKDQIVLLAENAHMSVWSPYSATTKPLHKVQLDMALRAPVGGNQPPVGGSTSTGAAVPANSSNSGAAPSAGPAATAGGNSGGSQTQTWATDFVFLPTLGKFVLSSGEGSLWFYDAGSYEPLFVVTHMEDTPLRLDAFENTETRACTLLVGDHAGYLCVLTFPQFCFQARRFKEHASHGKIKREPLVIELDDLRAKPAFYGGITYLRWSVHNDWVSALMYCEPLRLVISASNDEDTALVVGEIIRPPLHQPRSLPIDPEGPSTHFFQQSAGDARKNPNQTVFAIFKGVRCLAYSAKANVVVTGGMDRVVRLWNPYVNLRPSGVLQGHGAPIEQLCVQDSCDRIFSISSDRELRVWDLSDMQCLVTLSYRRHGITSNITASYFHPRTASLILAADSYHVLALKTGGQASGHVVSHDSAVTCATYDERFCHAISGSADGEVKVWDVKTGGLAFEFLASEAKNEDTDAVAPLTDLVLDASQRRLITAQIDGTLLVWNYNNGQLLRQLNKGSSAEVTSLAYLQQGMSKMIISAGWDRRLQVFKDSPEDDLMVAPCLPMQGRWADVELHDDDILALAVCPPKYLASAAYNGQIFVWNMSSASVTVRLKAPPKAALAAKQNFSAASAANTALLEENAILCLAFVNANIGTPNAPHLVAGGCASVVYIWSIAPAGALLASFGLPTEKPANVTTMTVTADGQTLLVGDDAGWLYAYRMPDVRAVAAGLAVVETAEDQEAAKAPPFARRLQSARSVSWHPKTADGERDRNNQAALVPQLLWRVRGHLASVTTVCLVTDVDFGSESRFFISTSTDKRARMWTLQGEFVGTFGQEQAWQLDQPITWEHPERPPEVVEQEEAEHRQREEEERLQHEWEELGIYEDTSKGTGIGSDEEDQPHQAGEDEQGEGRRRRKVLRKAKEAVGSSPSVVLIEEEAAIGDAVTRTDDDDDTEEAEEDGQEAAQEAAARADTLSAASTALRQKSAKSALHKARQSATASASQRRLQKSATAGAERTTQPTSSAAGLRLGSAVPRSAMARQRTATGKDSRPGTTAATTAQLSKTTNIFELRTKKAEGMARVVTSASQRDSSSSTKRQASAAVKAHLDDLRKTAVTSNTFDRMASASRSGNWERYLKASPHRLNDKVYQSLPYHELAATTVAVKKPGGAGGK